MGEYYAHRKFLRPVCVQCADKHKKDIVIEKYKDSKTKKSPILEWHSFSPRKFEKK
jgi:hypothetical protein